MKTLNEKRLEFLEDTVKYYSQDINRRAVSEDGKCKYKTKDGKKCAIGRFLIEEKYDPCMDESEFSYSANALIKNYPNCLPENIVCLGGNFLSDVQMLHDHKPYWGEKGLSELGKLYIDSIKTHISKNNYY